ncbi:class I adenylate-forming enzyme family protein [Rhodococcus sp. X156]|uniref:class I adenylate-forming enzyme family protein n=1 Tax=Rhodococcus sp. X156 TaxID=2499145 RepID=UPI000FD8DDE3|nr:class I adenylate-forming enzyme family protein [Rhodococcus sp. X156]
MTAPADLQAYVAQVMGKLTGPGGPFEIAEEDVLGTRMPVITTRNQSLPELLAQAESYGERDYLVTEDRHVSFAEHGAAVRSLAQELADTYGVGKGDRVAILGANSPEWVEAFWAVASLGAIAVGFNAWWTPPEITFAIGHSEPTVILVDRKRAPLLEQATVSLPPLPVLGLEDDVPRLATAHPDAVAPVVELDEDDPAVILYTSGTSGRPKGVVHSQRNLLAVVSYHQLNDALLAAFGQTGPEPLRYLLTSPLFHIASLHNLAVPRLGTGSVVVMYQGAFDVDRVLSLIERERVTNWGAVPTMASRLLEQGDFTKYDTSSLTAFALASAPSSIALKDKLRNHVPFAKDALVDSYGMTESSTAATVATAADLAANPGTLGRPIVTVALEIRDPFGDRLPDGEEGEVCVRSPFVMLGYWNNPEATAQAIDSGRWLRTGDIGVFENGMLRLTTRRSDLILRGGENVYPVEVEQSLDECPGVVECVVYGVAHADLGQEVAAVVVTDPANQVTEDQLRTYAEEHLAYYKRPVRYRITTDALPRNATGKIIRREVTG